MLIDHATSPSVLPTRLTGSQQSGAPAVSSRANANANAAHGDQLRLTDQARQAHPYEDFAARASTVRVQDKDTMEGILRNQGYSLKDIYGKDGQGRTMLDRVVEANNLRNANMIYSGRDLLVPEKGEPIEAGGAESEAHADDPVVTENEGRPEEAGRVENEGGTEEAGRQDETRQDEARQDEARQDEGRQDEGRQDERRQDEGPQDEGRQDEGRQDEGRRDEGQAPGEQPENADETQPREYTVKRGDNLERILRDHGYSVRDLYARDDQGNSLLQRIGAANGISEQNKIQAGQTLSIPAPGQPVPQATVDIVQPPPPQPPEVRTEPEAGNEPRVEPTEPRVEPTEPRVEPNLPADEPRINPGDDSNGRAGSEMGLLLDGARNGKFTRTEFQFLNSVANRYVETRVRYAKDGYTNEELRALGEMERQYGMAHARLEAQDLNPSLSVRDANHPATAARLRLHRQSGEVWDGFMNGNLDADQAIQEMIEMRADSRRLGEQY